MLFEDLQNLLLENLRARVRNGQLTERSLARMTGVSQPHIHNVLKGARILSPDIGDQILRQMNLSLLDLLDRNSLRLSPRADESASDYSYVRLLKGRIGPGHPWPTEVSSVERFCIPSKRLLKMEHPVAATTGHDARMQPVFSQDDLVVLDQSSAVRKELEADAYYLIKRGDQD